MKITKSKQNTKNYKNLKKELNRGDYERVVVKGKVKLVNKKTNRKVKSDGKIGKDILKKIGISGLNTGQRKIKFEALNPIDVGNNWIRRKFVNNEDEGLSIKELATAVINEIKPAYKKYMNVTFRAYSTTDDSSDFRSVKYLNFAGKNKNIEIEKLTKIITDVSTLNVYKNKSDEFGIGSWIDTSYFAITYKAISGGSGRKDYKSVKALYFKAESYPSEEGDCLLAILRTKGQRIKTIREELGLKGPIKIEDMQIVENYFKTNINIYLDEIIEVKTIHDTQTSNKTSVKVKYVYAYKSQKTFKETIDILLKDEHYSLIVEKRELNYDPICGELLKTTANGPKKMSKLAIRKSLERQDRTLEIKKDKRKLEDYERKFIFFDIETVFDPYERNTIKPYSISFYVTEEKSVFNPTEDNIDNYKDRTYFLHGEDCIDDFIEWIENNSKDVRYVLIGYNNSRFDNFPLIKGLMDADIFSSMLYVQNSLLQLNFGSRHKCFDLCRFTMCSLKTACKDFKVYPNKIEGFSHEEVQKVYNDGGQHALEKWITKNRTDLENYNKIDVLATAALFYAVRTGFKKMTNVDILDYLTLAHLSFECFKESLNVYDEVVVQTKKKYDTEIKATKKYDISAPKTKEDDDFIREAITGGRCQCFTDKPYTNKQLRCVDVKSLYPYVMLNRHYPVGEYKKTKKYIDDKLGIYRVLIIDQPKIKIIPDRSTEVLDWDSENDIYKNITSIEIECLKRYGGKIEFIPDDQGYIGLYWEKSTTKLYNDFFLKIKNEKTKQDILKADVKDRKKLIKEIKDESVKKELKETKEEYNPALRNIAKLLLNSLSGKMVQRNFDTKEEMVKNDKEEQKFISKTKNDITLIASFGPYKILSGTLEDDLVYKQKNAKPSYLGVFIYAHSRTYMYDILYSNYNVLYTDTDSGIITDEDYQDFSKKYIKVIGKGCHRYYKLTSTKTDTPTIGGDFGQFEEELNTEGKKCESYIIAKKIYCVEIKDKDGKIQPNSKYRMKGIKLPRADNMWSGDVLLTKEQKKKIKNYDEEKNGNKAIYLFNLKKKLNDEHVSLRKLMENEKLDIQMFRNLYKDGEISFLCGGIKKTKKLEMKQSYVIKTITLDENKIEENEEII